MTFRELLRRKEPSWCIGYVKTRDLHDDAVSKFIEKNPMNLSNTCNTETG
jgi:hypothetical protein